MLRDKTIKAMLEDIEIYYYYEMLDNNDHEEMQKFLNDLYNYIKNAPREAQKKIYRDNRRLELEWFIYKLETKQYY